MLVGVDEAGRGALAGPVVAAAVALPDGFNTSILNDSKRLSANDRKRVYDLLYQSNSVIRISVLSHRYIDRINIFRATMEAMRRCLLNMPQIPSKVLIDGNKVPNYSECTIEAVVGGDALISEISAASIIAKVTRDRIMESLHMKFPQYGFAEHKGYGTKSHYASIFDNGISNVHRRSFNLTRQESLFE